MKINLTNLNIDNKINNSYLKSSDSNGSYPYIKGKKYESIFGNNKIVIMDSHLNKYYISQIRKQENIKQEKKILELIEKLDNQKAFNVLREDYLKEKYKISKGYYLKKKENKKDYFSNLINLDNYKEKLLNENKSSNAEGEFLKSLMSYLGNRPKKIIVNKKNKKIELLSQFKSFSQRKKELQKLKKPPKRKSIKLLLNLENLVTPISKNEKFFNYYNMTTPSSIMNNNYNNNNNNSDIKKNLILKLNESNENNIKVTNNPYLKTHSTNFGLTQYNNFYTPKGNLNYKFDYDNIDNKVSFNNLKIDEINKETSFGDSISDSNFMKTEEKLNFSPIKKINSSKINNLILNKFKSNKSNKSIKLNLSSNKNNYLMNFADKDPNTKNEEKKPIKNIDNNNMNTYNKTEVNFYKKDKNNYFNLSEDEENLEGVKMIDLKIINDKLYKKHRKIMKKFLDKIRIEEKNIKETSNKLSNSLSLIKKIYNQKFLSDKNEKNLKKGYNTERIENKKRKNYKTKNKVINSDFIGKSKYRLPKVNRIIFGSLQNNKDQFEILQYNLQNEVIKQVEKRGFSKKIKINGRDILDKLKIKEQKNSKK